MALGGRMRRYFINLGGGAANIGAIRWGFRAPRGVYRNIGSGLGVNEVNDNERSGIVYGANNPKPARVRISYIDAVANVNPLVDGESDDKIRSVVRFCEHDKLGEVLFGSLNGQRVFVNGVDREFDIENVTLING